jgi:hypothetical protein
MTRRAWQHVGVAAIVALVAIVCIWCIWVVRAFELTKPCGHNLLKAAGLAFSAPNLVNITYGSVAFGFALAGGLAALVYQVGNPRQQRHNFVRGSEFIESGELARYTRKVIAGCWVNAKTLNCSRLVLVLRKIWAIRGRKRDL